MRNEFSGGQKPNCKEPVYELPQLGQSLLSRTYVVTAPITSKMAKAAIFHGMGIARRATTAIAWTAADSHRRRR